MVMYTTRGIQGVDSQSVTIRLHPRTCKRQE